MLKTTQLLLVIIILLIVIFIQQIMNQLESKIEELNGKLGKHIDFIDDTYERLKNPINKDQLNENYLPFQIKYSYQIEQIKIDIMRIQSN